MRRVAILSIFLCFSMLAADHKGKGKNKNHQGRGKSSGSTVIDIHFGSDDIRTIRQYYTAHPVNLPPGLQKKLARGKPLPPGWQKKLQPFPASIYSQLGPLCSYCERGVFDGYGVIYDKKTAVILDVIQLAGDILR